MRGQYSLMSLTDKEVITFEDKLAAWMTYGKVIKKSASPERLHAHAVNVLKLKFRQVRGELFGGYYTDGQNTYRIV